MRSLPRSTPAEQGVDSDGLDAFVAAAGARDDVELHSLMVLRRGAVVAERWWQPYAADRPHLLYSLSKSFTSTALGFAVAEGLVDLDATVLSYFPEFDAEVTDRWSRAMRVRHVAAMASGHDDETFERALVAGAGDLLLGLLRTPPDREPGTVFAYNQPCTYAVSAIVQRVSGGSLTGFLRPRLYEPLGIDAYGWRRDRTGREIGYAGLYTTTESIAKLGQLYLQDGEWQGEPVLSPEWVAEATRPHVATPAGQPDWSQGYGLQFWRSRHGYRGDGAYGQFMLVLPEADAVVAITGQSPDMQAVLDDVWTHLLPALTAGGGPDRPGSPAVAALGVPPGSGNPGTPRPGRFAPAADGPLSEVELLDGGGIRLTDSSSAVTAALGRPGEWTDTGPLAVAHTWQDGRLLADVVFAETPHRLHLVLDPAPGTFTARWQTAPLGAPPVGKLRSPG